MDPGAEAEARVEAGLEKLVKKNYPIGEEVGGRYLQTTAKERLVDAKEKCKRKKKMPKAGQGRVAVEIQMLKSKEVSSCSDHEKLTQLEKTLYS